MALNGASWRGDILEVVFGCEDARGSTMVEVINAVASTPAITDMPLVATGYTATEYSYFSKYDVNMDSVVSSADIAAAMFFFAKLDIDVDWAEFVAFEKSTLESVSVSAERCDVNGDSVIDIQDCILISINIE